MRHITNKNSKTASFNGVHTACIFFRIMTAVELQIFEVKNSEFSLYNLLRAAGYYKVKCALFVYVCELYTAAHKDTRSETMPELCCRRSGIVCDRMRYVCTDVMRERVQLCVFLTIGFLSFSR